MTGDEFKAARIALGLDQVQAARLLGYGGKARISEVENGRRAPGAAVVLLIRAYLAGYRPSDWPPLRPLRSLRPGQHPSPRPSRP